MTSYEHYPLNIVEQVLENQVEAHYAQYKAEPTFKQRLQSRLNDEIKEKSARPAHRSSFAQMFSSPVVKWMTGVLAFVLLVILSLGITPVRNAIGKALDLGYIDGVGFVRVSETFVLNGSIVSDRESQAIVIDRVVMNSDGTRVWFHSTGETMSWSNIEGEPFAFMETDNQQYPVRSWGWDDDSQRGILEFSETTPSSSLAFVLHIQPDWIIPIPLTPMSASTDGQTMMIFSDLCDSHNGIELCVQAFVSDSTGYHLLLNASSANLDFYLESLDMTNHLTGQGVQLVDSSGNHLQKGSTSSPEFSLPFEIPVEEFDAQREAGTTLHFIPSSQDSHSLTLTAPGLTVKTPVDQTITCDAGDNPVVSSKFPCEVSITIGGNVLNFHTGEVLQGQTGIQLRITSDPIQPQDNLLLTRAYLENLNGGNSTVGAIYEVKTRQLVFYLEQETFSPGQSFNIRIVDGYLTILEPYQFNWEIEP